MCTCRLADTKAIHLSSMTSLAGSGSGKTTAAGHNSVLCEFQGPNFAYTERIYFAAAEEIVDPVSSMVGKLQDAEFHPFELK